MSKSESPLFLASYTVPSEFDPSDHPLLYSRCADDKGPQKRPDEA
jgi:hypothetical protein